MAAPLLLREKEYVADPEVQQKHHPVGVRKVALVLAAVLGLFLTLEVILQIRSHITTGESIYNLLFGETRYIEDPATGLTLLRPNRIFKSKQITLRSNSLGLRSPEISSGRIPGSWRLAVVGASTVMGAYAADTDQTFSGQLEQRLRRDFPGRPIDVINAGIVGYKLDDEQRMLETRVAGLKPDLTIVYTGFNDFLDYCQEKSRTSSRARQGLPLVTMPSWLISVDLLKKNTVFLRTAEVKSSGMRSPDSVDLTPYRAKLEALIKRADDLGVRLMFTTNARAYRPDQSRDEQISLSETDRYYNHCFDVDALHTLYDRHNALIRAVAASHGIPVISLDQIVPGGLRYFADSHHFSAEGEVLVANALADFILGQGLLPE